MRLGVLGGSFDPIHLGHLLVADDVRRQLKLDRVMFVPTLQPPHRIGPLASFRHRIAMARLALESQSHLELCTIEERLPIPSYTVETLRAFRRRYRTAAIYFILGSDQYREMATWHEPLVVARLARLAVMSRPGIPRPALYPGHPGRRVAFVEVIPVSIAARVIRGRLAKGESVQYMLPTRVSDYIRRHRLYSETKGRKSRAVRIDPAPWSRTTAAHQKEKP